MTDGVELWDIGTDPFNADTDGDSLNDKYEVYMLESDPLVYDVETDSDKDGLSNVEEYRNHSNPYLADSDFDRISDLKDSNVTIPNSNSTSDLTNFCVEYELGKYDKEFIAVGIDGEKTRTVFNTISKECKFIETDNSSVLFFYDNDGNMSTQVCNIGGEKYANVYSYDSNKVVSIAHSNIKYYWDYDKDGNVVSSKVGNQIIANHTYKDSMPKLTKFQNGQSIGYKYEKDRISEVFVNGKKYYEKKYDKNGNLVCYNDKKNHVKYQYTYDNENNLDSIEGNNGFKVEYSDNGKQTSYAYKGDIKSETSIIQDKLTKKELGIGGNYSVKVENDIQENVLINAKHEIVYKNIITQSSDNTVNVSNGANQEAYLFDNSGQLIKNSINGKTRNEYTYDVQGRLKRTDSRELNETILYEYDTNDNIIRESHYEYKKDILKYSNDYRYDEDNWNMLLTEYNGKQIKYDEIGNPTTYINGESFKWDQGRVLSEIAKEDKVIKYFYNSDGYRVSKNIDGVITNYLLEDSKIVAEETKGKVIWYSFDTSDIPIGFEYNNQKYYYQKNIKNDIISIYDETGNKVVEYIYDDWGKVVNIVGDKELGNMNHFRYRSYYFDEESGFYYLESRYYDCETGRFINADENMVTYNAYAYCNNNPINFVDYTGHSATITYYCLAIAFVGILALVAYFQLVNFMELWRNYFAKDLSRLVSGLLNISSRITSAIASSVYGIADSVSLYIADKIRAYASDPAFKSSHEVHHIVAQTAAAAKPARDKLEAIGMSVHDSANLVALRTGMHKHLHTPVYYNFVNMYIVNAYNASPGRESSAIRQALNQLRMFLLAISAGCPF